MDFPPPRRSRPTTIRRSELPSLVNPFGRTDVKKNWIGKDLGVKMLRNRHFAFRRRTNVDAAGS
jgi:hypothetical protein